MNTEKRIKWLFLIIPFLAVLSRYPFLDNDFYFICATGKLITETGFPHTDMLSMHSNMNVVIQQWLSSVVYWFIYDLAGKIGVIVFTYIVYYLICLLTYRICKLISGNPTVSAICSALSDLMIFNAYVVSRPQIITFALLLAEVFFLELCVKEKKTRYLAALPILSIFLVNCHASMWLMFFVFILPYIAASLPLKIKNFEYTPCCNIGHLLIVSVISFAAGIINPYGTKGMFYLFSSYGQDKLNSAIKEMQPTNIATLDGKVFFACIALFAVVALIYRKRAFTPRLVFLFAGTILLALMHYKSLSYFWLFGIPSCSYLLKDLDISLFFENEFFKKNKSVPTTILAVIFLLFTLAGVKTFFERKNEAMSRQAHIDHLENIVGILNDSSEEVVLYANFNDGQYFEFRGFHPYIDGRAELFVKKLNGEFDYFNEYYTLLNAGIYYRDFIDKYDFNYLVISKDTDRYLYATVSKDEDFEPVYESDDVILYTIK